jgi:uncharacterized membrane protein
MASWKRDAASGLVIVLPILICAYVVYWIFQRIADVPVLNSMDPELKVAVLLALFTVTVLGVGYMMRTKVGDAFELWIDDLANRVPLIRVVYNASKMAVETAVSGTDELQHPVKLEVWSGLRMTAFKTGKTTDDGRDVLFLPTSPNITTGFVVEVEPDAYEAVDESVEEALTRILSAGFGETNETEAAPPFPIGGEDDADDGEDGEEFPQAGG